jgi:hypothetical protein
MQTSPFRLDSDAVVLTACEAAERALELMPTNTRFRTPTELVKVTSGAEAVAVVRAGRLLDETAAAGTVDPTTGRSQPRPNPGCPPSPRR